MAYGIQIYNNNNLVQIDENYKTYEIGSFGVMNGNVGTITLTSIEDIALIQPIYSGIGLSYDPSGLNGPTTLYSEPYNNLNGVYYPFNYVVLKPKNPTIAASYGLAVYNSSGVLLFDSNQLAGTFSGMYMFTFEANETYTGPKLLKRLFLPAVPSGMSRYFTMSCYLYAVFPNINDKTVVDIYPSTFTSGALGSLFTLLVMDIYV